MTSPSPLLHRARRGILTTLLALWIAALVLSHFPVERLPEMSTSDKRLHFAGFFLLSGLLLLSLAAYGVRHSRRIPIALVMMVLYAAIDETTQPWFNRSCDSRDFLADVLGAVAAIVGGAALVVVQRKVRTPARRT